MTRYAPDVANALWLPARAFLGDILALMVVFSVSAMTLVGTVYIFAPRFGQLALSTAGVSTKSTRQVRQSSGFCFASWRSLLQRSNLSIKPGEILPPTGIVG